MKAGSGGESILSWDEADKEVEGANRDALIAYGIKRLERKAYVEVQLATNEGARMFYIDPADDTDTIDALVRFGRIVTKYFGPSD